MARLKIQFCFASSMIILNIIQSRPNRICHVFSNHEQD
jgi:hypothetical protein